MILDIAVLRGIVLIWAVTTMCESAIELLPFQILVIDSSDITKPVELQIKPNKLSEPKTTGPERRSYDIEELILGKVNDLKPFLNDNNIHENKTKEVTKENEVSSRNVLRVNTKPALEKNSADIYKNIRERTNKALRNESASDKIMLLQKTIDNLMTKAIDNECFWNSGNSDDNNSKIILNMRKEMEEERAKHWEYSNDEMFKFNESKNKDSDVLSKFNKLDKEIINQFNNHSKKYKIKCQLIDTTKKEKKNKDNQTSKTKQLKSKKYENSKKYEKSKTLKKLVRTEKKEKEYKHRFSNELNPCANFRVCSEELKMFLKDFYKNLNDTAVSVFGNYAEMYNLDVKNDGEKQLVHDLIKNLSSVVKHNVATKFGKEMNKFQLSERKNQTHNYKIIKGFVRTTIKNVKKKLKQCLQNKIVKLKNQKTRTTVKADIAVNLDVDLNNLERDIKNGICTIFAICNGQINTNTRRLDKYTSGKDVSNKNDIGFKVQLTIDEKVDELFEESRKNYGMLNFSQVFNFTKKYNVTRTTLMSSPIYYTRGVTSVQKEEK